MNRSPLHILCVFLVFLAIGIKSYAQINTSKVMIMGRNALYYEDYVLSIQRFNMVISAKPHLAEPYFYRGLAKFYLGDYSGAEADCGMAIERNPYFENNYALRALCRINMSNYVDAEQDYAIAVGINPMTLTSWYNMALCQLEQEKIGQADSTLDVLLERWPRHIDGYSLKSQVAMERKDTTDALKWIDKALAIEPYDGRSWMVKAMISCNRGNYKQGEEELDRAILQMPRNVGLYINRALARYNQQNLRGAMSDYDAALEIEPGNYLGHFNRGLLRASVGDDNRGIEDFNFVLEQEPDNMIALYNRALLLDNTGDYKGAIRDISMVIGEYPEFWDGYRMRASIRRKIGDVYGAERDEYRVLKANMEQRAGTYKSQAKTRRREDRNPEDFNKLIEEPMDNKPEYASEYRGRVQDRNVDLVPEPFYLITYYKKESNINKYVAFHRMIDQLNTLKVLPIPVFLANSESSISESRMRQHFGDIHEMTNRIQQNGRWQVYLRRAMNYYHVRDFESAIADLDSVLIKDKDNLAALFLRAQVRCSQQETRSLTTPQESLSADAVFAYRMALKDLQRALNLCPDMQFAYYNIGNIYIQLQEYDNAIQAYTDALHIDPTFPDAYYNRGVAHLLANHLSQGLEDLSQAGELGLYGAYNLIKKYSNAKK